MQRSLDPETQLVFIEAMQKRLEPIAWFCMSLLLVTGLFQMSVNPHYDGFLSTSTQWSLAILTKHLLGIVMVVVSAIQTWEVIPAIRRAIMKSKKNKNTEELDYIATPRNPASQNELWIICPDSACDCICTRIIIRT